MFRIGICKICGCTDDFACVTIHGPCSWVSEIERDLCSACDSLNAADKKIYKISHYYSTDHNKFSVFIETVLNVDFLVRILGAIQLKFEELVDDSESMDEKHLITVLEKFYDISNVTKDNQKYLPQTQLSKEEWEMINEFSISTLTESDEVEQFTITQIDLYEAREFCSGYYGFKKVMETISPNNTDFDNEIKNVNEFYPWLQND